MTISGKAGLKVQNLVVNVGSTAAFTAITSGPSAASIIMINDW